MGDEYLIWVVVSALCADSFEPQARRYTNRDTTDERLASWWEIRWPGGGGPIQRLTRFPRKIDSPPANVEWDGHLSLSGTIKETPKKAMKKFLFLLLSAAAILNTAPVCIGAQTLYPVVVNGRWGFVNKSGETVINPQFDHAGGFVEGLAPVRMGRWGYVDASGQMQINPQFDKADVFSEGLAAVKFGGGPGPFVPYDPRPFESLPWRRRPLRLHQPGRQIRHQSAV